MNSLFDQSTPSPCPAPFNMSAHVLRLADRQPGKIALSALSLSASEDWTYGSLKSAILATGTGLLELGLKPGNRILLRLGNTVDFPVAYLGAIFVGLVPVPTSTQLTEREVAKIIGDLKPSAILHDPSIACPEAPGIKLIDSSELKKMRDLNPAHCNMGDPNRMAYIIYTSGTSGTPRAVCHAHRAIWARQMMHQGWYGLTKNDCLLHAGAFNWTYTLGTGLMDPWSIGATALIPTESVEIKSLPFLLKRHKATIFAASPGVYRKILRDNIVYNFPDLRHGLTAGEKLSETTREHWFAATNTPLYEAYGMSECSTFISSSPKSPAKPGTLGKPQSGRRVAIVNDTGPVPIGTEGTIAVSNRDPGLMLGYLNAPNDTASLYQGEWFLTGDLAVMDADFSITFKGRADDMMNAGGYRVSPLEVEALLLQFPGVISVGVTDVEVKPNTRIIAVFYTAITELDETAFRAYVEQNVARYKQPKLFQRMVALPTNPNGKLNRRALRTQFEASL